MSDPEFKPPPPRTRRTDRLTAPYRGPDRRQARPADEETPAQLMASLSREAWASLLFLFFYGLVWFGIGWFVRELWC